MSLKQYVNSLPWYAKRKTHLKMCDTGCPYCCRRLGVTPYRRPSRRRFNWWQEMGRY